MTGEPSWPFRNAFNPEEVARELALTLERLRAQRGASSAAGVAPAKEFEADDPLVGAGARYQRCRVRRPSLFDDDDPADPAWDILIELYLAAAVGREVTVSTACLAALVPSSTALRWIDRLCTEGFVVRTPDIKDRRRKLLWLTATGRESVRAWLALLDRGE